MAARTTSSALCACALLLVALDARAAEAPAAPPAQDATTMEPAAEAAPAAVAATPAAEVVATPPAGQQKTEAAPAEPQPAPATPTAPEPRGGRAVTPASAEVAPVGSARVEEPFPERAPPPPGPASAPLPEARVGVAVAFQNAYVGARDFDLVASDDSLPGLGVLVRYGAFDDLPALALEAGWGYGGRTARAFGAYDTSLLLHTFRAGAAWLFPRYRLGRGAARVNLLLDLGRVALEDAARATTLRDWAPGGGVEATLGWELAGARGWALSLDLGWAWRALPLRFSELSEGLGEDVKPPRIATLAADAGSLSLSGLVWRLGCGYRF